MSDARTPSALAFKTQQDALFYLKEQGYKVEKSTISNAVRSGLLPRNSTGKYEAAALLAYAAANLVPAARAENRDLAEASASRTSADAELKHFQAQRTKLKLLKEQGMLMPKADHERDLAARALFFRNEVRNFVHLYGPEMIIFVGGSESKLRDFVSWWEEKTGIWMDAWAQEREFLVADDDVEADEADQQTTATQADEAEDD
ncbi:MAG: hypothetical protein EOM56_13145 [Deltaproteobacteria bacterium]|nr:hypothetical protein [Deltaproteobacteria bacterium]